MHTQTRHDTQKITQFDSNSSTRNVFHGSEYQFAAWKLFVLCALFHDLVNHHQFVKHTSQKKAYVSILYMCVNWNRLFWLEWERETHSPRRTFFFFVFCAYFIFAMWILWVLSVIAFFSNAYTLKGIFHLWMEYNKRSTLMSSTKNTLRPCAIRHNELCLKNRFYRELTLYYSINAVNAAKLKAIEREGEKIIENKNERKNERTNWK